MKKGKKRKKREIRIFAPFRPVIRPEEAEMRAHERNLEEERVKVLTFSRKIRRQFYVLPMIAGLLLLGFLAYMIATKAVLTAGSPEATMLFIAVIVCKTCLVSMEPVATRMARIKVKKPAKNTKPPKAITKRCLRLK